MSETVRIEDLEIGMVLPGDVRVSQINGTCVYLQKAGEDDAYACMDWIARVWGNPVEVTREAPKLEPEQHMVDRFSDCGGVIHLGAAWIGTVPTVYPAGTEPPLVVVPEDVRRAAQLFRLHCLTGDATTCADWILSLSDGKKPSLPEWAREWMRNRSAGGSGILVADAQRLYNGLRDTFDCEVK